MSAHIRSPKTSASAVCAQELAGRISRIVWASPEEDGPVILRLHDDQAVKVEHGSGTLAEGEYVRFLGQYTEHQKYGRQFAASTWLPSSNGDRHGAIKYLADLCDGIGLATAKRLVDAYGVGAVRILREQPERCVEDKLLSALAAGAASAKLAEHAVTERVFIELHGLLAGRGFGGRSMRALWMRYGDRAAEITGGNPYRLLIDSIVGAGWRRVDRLYLDRGGDPAALKRQAMAGWDALRRSSTGSTWHPVGLFAGGICTQLGHGAARVDDALRLAVRGKLVVESPADVEAGLIADPAAAASERAVAYYLSRLMRAGAPAWPKLSAPDVSEHQAEQINGAASCRVLLLTGTPGTGKTFAAAALLRLVARSHGTESIAVAAPTGKAAVRITESLRRNGVDIEATTIHRLLHIRRSGYDGNGWEFEYGPSTPMPYSWVAIDEVSMLDCDLAASLFAAIRPGTHVVLIGDPYQLPPVGHGAPLRDCIGAGTPTAELTEIKRNDGLIVRGCRQIKDGRTPAMCQRLNADAGDNLRMLVALTELDQRNAVRAVLEALRTKPGLDVIDHVAVLTPTNDSGAVSRKPLNDYLQSLLNPVDSATFRGKQDVWRIRDKVICLKNGLYTATRLTSGGSWFNADHWCKDANGVEGEDAHFIANGELGRVVAVDPANTDSVLRFVEPNRFVRIKAPARVQHRDGSDSAREEGFALGYAMTGHKSQGSEWPYVLVILDPAGDRVASREWIYTAISRARTACLLIGTEETLRRQLRRAELPGRKTLLRELIGKELRDGKSS